MTMQLVKTTTVGSGGAAAIEFTSIPQTGNDLILKVSTRGTYSGVANVGLKLVINNDSGSNYAYKNLRVTNGLVQSFGGSGNTTLGVGWATGPTATASTFSNNEIYIPNYTTTSTKSIKSDSNAENNVSTQYEWFLQLDAGSYTTSSAITTLSIQSTYGDNFAEFSTVSLYTVATTGATGATVS